MALEEGKEERKEKISGSDSRSHVEQTVGLNGQPKIIWVIKCAQSTFNCKLKKNLLAIVLIERDDRFVCPIVTQTQAMSLHRLLCLRNGCVCCLYKDV